MENEQNTSYPLRFKKGLRPKLEKRAKEQARSLNNEINILLEFALENVNKNDILPHHK